ncbi:hypothetical protein LIMHP_10495 [Leptospira interrogans serovar Manilae]|nr:hypothetical protein LIMLP_10485 [Leptospira interrogans serovar Manilae]AKP30105.1 hypothetical protein LIMHP_10495 [Leptospira interrogans serovar Manilae]
MNLENLYKTISIKFLPEIDLCFVIIIYKIKKNPFKFWERILKISKTRSSKISCFFLATYHIYGTVNM